LGSSLRGSAPGRRQCFRLWRTNFHVVVEEYLPGVLTKESVLFPGADLQAVAQAIPAQPIPVDLTPYRGLLSWGRSPLQS